MYPSLVKGRSRKTQCSRRQFSMTCLLLPWNYTSYCTELLALLMQRTILLKLLLNWTMQVVVILKHGNALFLLRAIFSASQSPSPQHVLGTMFGDGHWVRYSGNYPRCEPCMEYESVYTYHQFMAQSCRSIFQHHGSHMGTINFDFP